MGRTFGGDAGGGKRGSSVSFTRQIPKFLRQYYADRGELPANEDDVDASDDGAIDTARGQITSESEDDNAKKNVAKKEVHGKDGADEVDEDAEISALQDAGFQVVVDRDEPPKSALKRERGTDEPAAVTFGGRSSQSRRLEKRNTTQRTQGGLVVQKESAAKRPQKQNLLSFDADVDDDDDGDQSHLKRDER